MDLSIRFDIDLCKGEDRFAEVSYLELLQKHFENKAETEEASTDDPFTKKDAEEQKKMEAIARSFTNKYGPLVTMKKNNKKKQVRVNDFVDPGDGYDVADPFIDDTEADNIAVAPNVMSTKGGFYVNKEQLTKVEDDKAVIEPPTKRFKGDRHSMKFTPPKRNKSKQLLDKAVRCLSVSKTNKTQSVAPSQTPNGVSPPTTEQSRIPTLDDVFNKVLSEAGPPTPNKPQLPPPTNNLPNSQPLFLSPSKPSIPTVAVPGAKPVTALPIINIEKSVSTNGPTPVPQKNGGNNKSVSNGKIEDSKTSLLIDTSVSLADVTNQSSLSTSAVSVPNTPTEPPKMPEHASADIRKTVSDIKQFVQTHCKNSGKNIFVPQMDQYLLQLDELLTNPSSTKTIRTGVYNFLEFHLPTKKSALQRRLRKLRESAEANKLDPLIEKLKHAVQQAMPELLQRHAEEMKNYPKRLQQWQDDVKNMPVLPDTPTDSSEVLTSTPVLPKKPHRPVQPRKVFSGNSSPIKLVRSIYGDIIMCKMDAFYRLSVKGSEEEYLKKFMTSVLIPLWPEGWITVNSLWKMAQTSLDRFKANMSTNKAGTPLNNNSLNHDLSTHKASTPLATHTTTKSTASLIYSDKPKTPATPVELPRHANNSSTNTSLHLINVTPINPSLSSSLLSKPNTPSSANNTTKRLDNIFDRVIFDTGMQTSVKSSPTKNSPKSSPTKVNITTSSPNDVQPKPKSTKQIVIKKDIPTIKKLPQVSQSPTTSVPNCYQMSLPPTSAPSPLSSPTHYHKVGPVFQSSYQNVLSSPSLNFSTAQHTPTQFHQQQQQLRSPTLSSSSSSSLPYVPMETTFSRPSPQLHQHYQHAPRLAPPCSPTRFTPKSASPTGLPSQHLSLPSISEISGHLASPQQHLAYHQPPSYQHLSQDSPSRTSTSSGMGSPTWQNQQHRSAHQAQQIQQSAYLIPGPAGQDNHNQLNHQLSQQSYFHLSPNIPSTIPLGNFYPHQAQCQANVQQTQSDPNSYNAYINQQKSGNPQFSPQYK